MLTATNNIHSKLISALSDNNPPWLMSQSERISLLGLLLLIKPKTVLEIGSNEGGCTKWLCSLCESVCSVDIVNKLSKSTTELKNLSFLNMTSNEAFIYFKSNNSHFDLIVIDGDHSYEGSKIDLINAINHGSIIICHDSYNPPCRQGYIDAIHTFDNPAFYYNLDFVQGTILDNELWGGLALIINDCNAIEFIDSNNNYKILNTYLEHFSKGKRSFITNLMHYLKTLTQRIA